MEIFIGIKDDLRRMGLLAYDHPYKKSITIFQYFFIYSSLFIHFLTPLWFSLFKAQTFYQRAESIFPFVAGFFATLMYSDLLWLGNRFSELIVEFEFIIKNRKLHSIYY